jgi:hypothetical protein
METRRTKMADGYEPIHFSDKINIPPLVAPVVDPLGLKLCLNFIQDNVLPQDAQVIKAFYSMPVKDGSQPSSPLDFTGSFQNPAV